MRTLDYGRPLRIGRRRTGLADVSSVGLASSVRAPTILGKRVA